MKKFLSLMLAAVMIVAVFAMVGCDKPETTTPADTTPATTTTATEATTTEATTTEATTTEVTTTEVTTTTQATTTTAKPVETTTTTEPVVTTTTAPQPTEVTTGTTLSVFDRFDFGTDSKAQAEGETSHEYIVANLTYDDSRVAVRWTEDTVKIYAKKSFDSAATRDSYALSFLDIVTYDFDDELVPGWGTWSGAPMNPGTSWVGRHQYAKLRILNNTTNNVVSIHWHRAGEGFATTTCAVSMYLQGGAPTTTTNHNLTTTATTEWAEYIYDMMFLSSAGREILYGGKTSYMTVVNEAKTRNGYAQNNWNTANGNITALNLHFLGAYGKDGINDTRKNIKMGACVEVDYIIFGSSIEQLEAYKSYMEEGK